MLTIWEVAYGRSALSPLTPQSFKQASLGTLIPIVLGTSPVAQVIALPSANDPSRSATRSDFHIAAARKAVLDYFEAPSEEYACIFTANATTALKIVGESFPFNASSALVIPADCHNSVNGIRRFAEAAGARVEYLQSTEVGGFYEEDAMVNTSPLN